MMRGRSARNSGTWRSIRTGRVRRAGSRPKARGLKRFRQKAARLTSTRWVALIDERPKISLSGEVSPALKPPGG